MDTPLVAVVHGIISDKLDRFDKNTLRVPADSCRFGSQPQHPGEGQQVEVSVTTARMPSETKEKRPGQPAKEEWFGIHVGPITPDMAKELGLQKAEGVVVEEVDAGSVAQDAGLRKGDVILEVNRQKATSVTDVQAEAKKLEGSGPLLLHVCAKGPRQVPQALLLVDPVAQLERRLVRGHFHVAEFFLRE